MTSTSILSVGRGEDNAGVNAVDNGDADRYAAAP
jgi:hypothetical protein